MSLFFNILCAISVQRRAALQMTTNFSDDFHFFACISFKIHN